MDTAPAIELRMMKKFRSPLRCARSWHNCTVFSLLNTFQQRVVSSSEIIFEFEPRSMKHGCAAAARVELKLSKPFLMASVSSTRKRARSRLCCWK